ncbi:MAG: hypothetical protein ACLFTT_11760 [Candidatus Hydrogenedentota bacterium]
MTDQFTILGLALFIGAVAAGAVWFGWDLVILLHAAAQRRRGQWQRQRDAAALENQAADRHGRQGNAD